MFESGKLAPGYDWFHCVVNIPEDIQRVGDPETEGEQLHVMAGGISESAPYSQFLHTLLSLF